MGYGKTLKLLCKQRGMTYRELAEKSGVTYGTITGIVSRDRDTIKINTLKKLCSALGITLREFCIESEIQPMEGRPTYRFIVMIDDEEVEYTNKDRDELKDLRNLMIRNLSSTARISPIQINNWVAVEGIWENGTRRRKD